MSRPRVGIVITHPIQYQVPLYRYLAASSSIEPLVFFLSEHGLAESFDPGFGRAVKYDVPLLGGYNYEIIVNRSPRPAVGTPWGVINPALPAAIRRSGIDVLMVHGYNNFSHWLAYATAASSATPYLLRGESRPDRSGMRGTKRLAKRAILSPLVRNASACLAIGQDNRRFFELYGAKADRIFFAPYSVDTARFSKAGAIGRSRRSEMLASIGLDDRAPLILYAGKLLDWKRPADVIFAVDRLKPKVNLVVIGDGPLRGDLEHLAVDRRWMRMLGFVNQSEIAEWYGAADLFILPSHNEPWGLAVNEAMAAGAVPIVSDTVGCAPDLVTKDIGWVYETGNIGALVEAISEGCRSGALVARRAAAQKRSGEYGLAATAHGIETAVEVVLSRS